MCRLPRGDVRPPTHQRRSTCCRCRGRGRAISARIDRQRSESLASSGKSKKRDDRAAVEVLLPVEDQVSSAEPAAGFGLVEYAAAQVSGAAYRAVDITAACGTRLRRWLCRKHRSILRVRLLFTISTCTRKCWESGSASRRGGGLLGERTQDAWSGGRMRRSRRPVR